ncbi:unnamed protein product [Vicia faba]|uniref:DUF4283 domain-containing protein n=1 Tax=Vicia faba TaxID=3906 RepID=A0AAV1B8D5_VICFA|nr:unnamed protein product [Vicia faba]
MDRSNYAENGANGRINIDPANLSAEELLDLCLIGTLQTNQVVRFAVLQDMLAQLRQPGQTMDIIKLDENKFLFQFYHVWDMDRVIQGGPWR